MEVPTDTTVWIKFLFKNRFIFMFWKHSWTLNSASVGERKNTVYLIFFLWFHLLDKTTFQYDKWKPPHTHFFFLNFHSLITEDWASLDWPFDVSVLFCSKCWNDSCRFLINLPLCFHIFFLTHFMYNSVSTSQSNTV